MIPTTSPEPVKLIARFAERLGVIPVRGSSSRGGREAFREMLRFPAAPGVDRVATVLDGPRGPRYQAKKGMIPLPFSRVVVSYEKPRSIPRKVSKEELECFRNEVETVLNRIREEADRMVGYREP